MNKKIDNYAPVVVFTYKRLEHLKVTLDTLNASPIASETVMYIFCDGFKNEIDKDEVKKVQTFVRESINVSHFKEINIVKNLQNKGLERSVIDGITDVLTKHDKVIVVEDDLALSPAFLEYMNKALIFYENDDLIWSISGYSFPMKALENYNHDIYYSGRICSWGWGTWKDRWGLVDWGVQTYECFKHDWKKRINFSKWGADLPIMLDFQMNGGINSWAIKWAYEAFCRQKKTIYPKKSYVSNLGIDGSGEHGSQSSYKKFATTYSDDINCDIKFEKLSENKFIRREFRKRYSCGMILNIKRQILAFLLRNKLYNEN